MKYLNDRCIVSDDNVFYYDSEQEITQADVMRFILENEQLAREYAKMRRYYKADHDAIVKAKQKPNNKPDNRLVLNYPKKLVDTFTGFAVGKPVQMTLPEDLGNEALSKFNVSRKMDSVIARVWKESCIYGRAYFYVYSHDSEIYVTDALPLDTFVIYDNTVAHKPLYAVRYGHIGASASYKLTVFSESYQWESDTSRNTSGFGSRVVNPFGMIPIIEAVENDERLSVIKNVLPLIDEIDKAMSEKTNDVDYFADAYMKVLGAILSEDDLENLRNYRIINLKSRESDDPNETPENLDVDFLSKPNADTTQENLINRVIDSLYQVSMITNLNDKDFGNSTGVALEMKYKPMLNLATLKSRGFTESLKDMYQVVFASDLIENISREAWKDLDINFQYDLPHDTLSEAQTAQILANLVSSETWLKTLSIVNDPRQEQERMDREKNEQMKANMQVLKQTNAFTDGDANANSRTSQKADRPAP